MQKILSSRIAPHCYYQVCLQWDNRITLGVEFGPIWIKVKNTSLFLRIFSHVETTPRSYLKNGRLPIWVGQTCQHYWNWYNWMRIQDCFNLFKAIQLSPSLEHTLFFVSFGRLARSPKVEDVFWEQLVEPGRGVPTLSACFIGLIYNFVD